MISARRDGPILAGFLLAMVCLSAPRITADVILDPKVVTKLLADIGKFQEESRTPAGGRKQLEALYQMGERVLDLTELMTKDLQSHGSSDPNLIGIILRRLKEYGVEVTSTGEGYRYDLAAFREYLVRAPRGSRAADARFVLVGWEEAGNDESALRKAIANKQQFIRDYPRYSEMSLVKYLLAQHYLHLARLYSSQRKMELSNEQRRRADDLFREIVKLYPKSPEAEAAADNLAAAK